MESLKSMWATVKAKLKELGMEFTGEYNPEMVFLDTLVERVHALEIKMGIVHTDPAPVDHGAVVDVLAKVEAVVDPAAAPVVIDPAAAPVVIDPAAAGDGSHNPGVINPNLVWNGKSHVEKSSE
jgi:hypothetical protein